MASQAPSNEPFPFRDPALPVERRIDDLLSRMTLEEKVQCLSSRPNLERLGLRLSAHVEGIHGLSQGGPANWTPPRKVPTTIFPQGYGLGHTWDPDLMRRIGQAEGTEARFIFQSPQYRQGALIILTPNADLGRDPRWGRTEECYGEDPVLVGELAVGMVKGLQGDDPKTWLSASLMKHFLANSNEDTREHSSSDFDERLWHEYYAYGFWRGVVEGGARAYMAAYNAWNGVPCHIHPMHEDLVRKLWGFDGMVCTDGGGYRLLVTQHKAFKTYEEAATAIIKTGIARFLDNYKQGVDDALAQGLLKESDLDKVLRTMFRVQAKLGLLDPPDTGPYRDLGKGPEPWTTQAHKDLALEATIKSIVLLKNDGLLPLDANKLKKVAVVGPRSNEVYLDWYSGMPGYTVTPVDGISERLGKGVEVLRAVDGDEAVACAKAADVAIVVVGNHPLGSAGWAQVKKASDGKEAVDRKSILLEEEDLVKKVMAVNPRTIVVLKSSFPFAITWSQEHVPAILHIAHCSQEEGRGIAEVLFGDANPAGRLTQTWVRSEDQLPPLMDYDIRNGRTYMYFKDRPLYPFGYGLSYTRFAYERIAAKLSGDQVEVAVSVKNMGDRDGEEVVQVYASFPDSKVERPRKNLVGFRRISISKGQTKEVVVRIPLQRLASWDVTAKEWRIESGTVELAVGPDSATEHLKASVVLP